MKTTFAIVPTIRNAHISVHAHKRMRKVALYFPRETAGPRERAANLEQLLDALEREDVVDSPLT